MPLKLDDVVIRWSGDTTNTTDVFTLRDAVRGLFITGTIGSGKSSGIGDLVAEEFIKKGFGGIVLCAKVGEADEWRKRAKRVGAMDRFIFFSKGSHYRFNPLEYEMSRTDEGGKDTTTMTNLFMSLTRLGNRMRGGSSAGSKDPFWDLALERMVKAMLDVLKLSRQKLTVNNMVKLLASMLIGGSQYNRFDKYCLEKRFFIGEMQKGQQTEEQILQDMAQSNKKTNIAEFKDWEKNYLIQCLFKIQTTHLSEDDALIYDVAKQLFLLDFPSLDQKLKVSLNETFFAFANPFRSGLLAKYFGSFLTDDVKPERTFEGKIIVLDFPVHQYGVLGSYAQVIYKQQWQDCVQRRKITPYSTPVFLYVDECQFFLNDADMLFATTARSALACNVFLTQNLSNLYATIGNKDRVHSLLSNLTTKCFHNNDSVVTNEWASKTIAQTKKEKRKGDVYDKEVWDETYDYQVKPQDFLSLKNGTPLNEKIVEGYLTRTGRPFSTGKNYILIEFEQQD